MTGLPIPAATFAVLKRGLDPKAPSILSNPSSSCSFVGNHDQRLFLLWCPKDAQLRFYRGLLPEPNRACKPLPSRLDQLAGREALAPCSRLAALLAGLLSIKAKQIMPVIPLAQRDHGKTPKRAIPDQS